VAHTLLVTESARIRSTSVDTLSALSNARAASVSARALAANASIRWKTALSICFKAAFAVVLLVLFLVIR